MNYTEKYHLPQWEETDRIMRVDFNEAMSGIEAGLATNAADAARAEAKADLPAIATGAYSGRWADQTITTGFRPSYVIISAHLGGGTDGTPYIGSITCVPSIGIDISCFQYTDDGFILKRQNSDAYPNINRQGVGYTYLAFR